MAKGLTLRYAERADAQPFTDLFNEQYGYGRTVAYFHWQYMQPHERTVLACMWDRGRLCGTFGIKRRRLSNGCVAGQVIDMLIRAAWRGMGLLPELAACAQRYFEGELDILCGLANSAGSEAVRESLGYCDAGTVTTLLRKADLPMPTTPLPADDRQEPGVRICFERPADYRKWRLEQNPRYHYDSVRVADAVAWTKIFADSASGRRYGDVVEVVGESGAIDDLARVVRLACESLRSHGADYITTWALPGTKLREIVEFLGFAEAPQQWHFVLKALKPECNELAELSKWELAQADSELF